MEDFVEVRRAVLEEDRESDGAADGRQPDGPHRTVLVNGYKWRLGLFNVLLFQRLSTFNRFQLSLGNESVVGWLISVEDCEEQDEECCDGSLRVVDRTPSADTAHDS